MFLVCSPLGWEEMEKQIKAKLEKIESLMENLLATFVSTSEKPLDLAEPAAYLSLSKSHLYHRLNSSLQAERQEKSIF